MFEFNSTSPNYGKLVKKVSIPTTGNEPHHGQFSYDGYRFGAAGILSFLYPIKADQPAQPQLYFFDTTDPRNPRFANSEKSALNLLGIPVRPDAAALDFGTADEFYPLPDNTFLVSGLGNRAGLNVGAQVRLLLISDSHSVTALLCSTWCVRHAALCNCTKQLDTAASQQRLTHLLCLCVLCLTLFSVQLAHLTRDGQVIGQYPSPLQLSSSTGTLLDGIQNVVGGTTDTVSGLGNQATHGITYTDATPKPLIITADFIEPLSTLTIAGVLNPGGLKYRVSVCLSCLHTHCRTASCGAQCLSSVTLYRASVVHEPLQ